MGGRGRVGATGRVQPPIVCKRNRQISGNKCMSEILPNTGQLSISGLICKSWRPSSERLAPGWPTEKLLHVRRLATSQEINSIYSIDC